MRTRENVGWVLAACLIIAPLATAHHSYAAFDSVQTRTLEGTISTVDWANPHVAFKLHVSAEGNGIQEWRIESSSPSILAHYGWTRSTLEPGEGVSVVVNPMSDGSYAGRLHTLRILKTGQTLQTKLSTTLKTSQN